jgi:hypothetical protein
LGVPLPSCWSLLLKAEVCDRSLACEQQDPMAQFGQQDSKVGGGAFNFLAGGSKPAGTPTTGQAAFSFGGQTPSLPTPADPKTTGAVALASTLVYVMRS